MTNDWPDYPTDQEYWERVLPDKTNIAKVMEGAHNFKVSVAAQR